MRKSVSGFTLVELAITIALIALLSMIGVVYYSGSQSRARDTKRAVDAKSIMDALSTYRAYNRVFPAANPNPGSGTFEVSTDTTFLNSLQTVINNTSFKDHKAPTLAAKSYWYRTFNAGDNGCPAAKGPYYVLWIKNMENQTTGKIDSPDCPGITLFTSNPSPPANVWYNGPWGWVIVRFE